MKFELSYIDKLAKLLNENNLSGIVLKDGEQVVELKKDNAAVVANVAPEQVKTVSAPVKTQVTEVQATIDEPKTSRKEIKSPMVGTFFQATAPDAEPLVSVGDVISKGQVVCIIEAMKLMNEIETEVSGKITKILVEDGQPVEYGQVLMYVE